MVTGANNCPFCDEEVYCIGSYECICPPDRLVHWPFYEQFKCPHCGIFNICIDRRDEKVQNQLHALQAVAAEENIEANQNRKYSFWVDKPIDKAICNPEIQQAIKQGLWIVRQLQSYSR